MDREQGCVFYLRVGRLIGLRLLCTSCAAACGLLCGGDMLLKRVARGAQVGQHGACERGMRSPMPIEANTSAASESAAQNTFAPINIADAEPLPPVNTLHITDAQPLPPATTHHKCELYLVRHGERLDEAPNAPTPPGWNDRPWWDPPLTTNGHSQARGAAERLKEAHARLPFACVYASPTCRTIQTARHIAAALHLNLVLVPGLAECAAAVTKAGLHKFRPMPGEATAAKVTKAAKDGRPPMLSRQKTLPRFVTPSEAQERPCPANTSVVCTAEASDADFDPYSEAFSESVERLARKHLRADGRVLMVTHREGIKDLAILSVGSRQKKVRSEYCAIAKFAFKEANKEEAASSFEMVSPPSAKGPLL